MSNSSSGLPFYVSMIVVIISGVTYQIFQKNIPANVHPVVSIIISYLIALIFSVSLFAIFPLKNSLLSELHKLNYATFLVGISIIGIEIGFLLAYRFGWNISSALPFSSSFIIIMLTLIGFFFYREQLTFTKIVGVILCISGIILINK